jgi:hypothetical protein
MPLTDETTGIIPRPSLTDRMRAQPGTLALLVAEWVGICLMVAAVCSIVFLLALGAYSLTRIAPS